MTKTATVGADKTVLVRDAAAAFAAVLRSSGVEWQTVQRLQSAVVALAMDELDGPLVDAHNPNCCRICGMEICRVCGSCHAPGRHQPREPVADLAGLAAHDQGDYCARCGERACICGLHDGGV